MRNNIFVGLVIMCAVSVMAAKDPNQDFFDAVKLGNPDTFAKLFDPKKNLNSVDSDGYSPIMYAAASLAGFEDTLVPVVQRLIKEKANLNLKNSSGETALMLAAAFPTHFRIAQLLVEAGADLAIKTTDTGMNALMIAASNNNLPLVKLLVKAKGIKLDEQSGDGLTALMFAIHEGNLAEVRELLNAGANPSIADSQGNTPLTAAARVYVGSITHEHPEPARQNDLINIVDLLIQRKGDRTTKNKNGKSFNDYAAGANAMNLGKFKAAK